MSEKELKVTDKRMFTADGELREEFRHLEEAAPAAEPAEAPPIAAPTEEPAAVPDAQAAPPPAAAPGAEGGGVAPVGEPPRQPAADTPRVEIPDLPGGLGEPTFLDLVGLLAEPVALYLGDAELPNGESAENLDMARLHIDLLEVLRRKTAGNLDVGESRVLEDLLYRCRLRYVQKRG